MHNLLERQAEVIGRLECLEFSPREKLFVDNSSNRGYSSVAAPYHSVAILGELLVQILEEPEAAVHPGTTRRSEHLINKDSLDYREYDSRLR